MTTPKEQPKVLLTQKDGREILDVTKTANRHNPLRAERRGRQSLILHKLDTPIKRFDGRRVSYQIETADLNADDDNELACVQVNEFEYYSARELEPYLKYGQPLFITVPYN